MLDAALKYFLLVEVGWAAMMDEVICKGYRPGVIGRMVELHATYYSENWGFGLFFEVKVATDFSEFLGRYDESRDGFWTLSLNNQIEGGIAIDGIKAMTEGAHLRWFILSMETRGRGFGNRLMAEAISFCKERHYSRVYLGP
jgi:GNAT superfamily N-acetyltransferase